MDSLDFSFPSNCGVMLLSGTPVFPNTSIELHIFEPRYRQMLADSLQDSWMFIMGSLMAEESLPYEECVAQMGTVVMVKSSRTLPDGRSSLEVTGLQLVEFKTWNGGDPYPMATYEMVDRVKMDEAQQPAAREMILSHADEWLTGVPPDVHASIMQSLREMRGMTALLDNVCYAMVGDSDRRQELYMEMDDGVRAQKLIQIISG